MILKARFLLLALLVTHLSWLHGADFGKLVDAGSFPVDAVKFSKTKGDTVVTLKAVQALIDAREKAVPQDLCEARKKIYELECEIRNLNEKVSKSNVKYAQWLDGLLAEERAKSWENLKKYQALYNKQEERLKRVELDRAKLSLMVDYYRHEGVVLLPLIVDHCYAILNAVLEEKTDPLLVRQRTLVEQQLVSQQAFVEQQQALITNLKIALDALKRSLPTAS